jgi:Ca2+-binding RTX toxin-like protein
LRHATIVDNVANGPDGGDQIRGEGPGLGLDIRNSVIRDADAADVCVFADDTTVTMDNVLVEGDPCGTAPGQTLFLSLRLGPLAPNDGPAVGSSFTDPPSILLTHGLLEGSAAIDAVPAASCVDLLEAPLTSDERGFPRPSPSNGHCDAGAFEVQQPEPTQQVPQEAPPTVESRKCRGLDATLVGTPDDDVLEGTAGRDVIFAGAGDDRIRARAGKDVVCGADGADRIRGGKRRDVLVGGAGPDRLFGGPGRDLLIGGTPGAGVPNIDSDRCVGGRGRDSSEGCGRVGSTP